MKRFGNLFASGSLLEGEHFGSGSRAPRLHLFPEGKRLLEILLHLNAGNRCPRPLWLCAIPNWRSDLSACRSVIGDCMPPHWHQECVRFLKQIDLQTLPGMDLHLIVDNYRTHKHPDAERCLGRHPRFPLHFTPTSCSWLNQVERGSAI